MPPPEAWSVARTMQAMEMLAFQPLSAPQVAAGMRIHPRTARRLLNRLSDEGYLRRSGDAPRLYAPTLRIVALAGQVASRDRLVRAAVDFVAQLGRRTGARAQLLIPSYRSVLSVLDASRSEPELGELLPCHCTAAGKALLAWRQAWRDSVLGTPLRGFTARTVTDPVALAVESDAIRRRGFATEDEEYRPGRRAVAAPVFTPDGDAPAALSATGVRVVLDELAGPVVDLAGRLTETLDG